MRSARIRGATALRQRAANIVELYVELMAAYDATLSLRDKKNARAYTFELAHNTTAERKALENRTC